MSQISISLLNSTTTPLGAGQSFNGTKENLTSWEETDINIAGAPSNANGTLYIEYSPDGINWDIIVPLVMTGPSAPPIVLRTILPWFRVRYTNGATPLTEFRLTAVLHRNSATRLTRFLSQHIDTNEPVEVVRIAEPAQTYKYDIQETVIYQGYAQPGTLTDDPYWTIERTLLTNGNPTEKKITTAWSAVWDDRSTETYW